MFLDKLISNRKLAGFLFFFWIVLIIILTVLPKAHIPELETSGSSGFRLDYPLHFLFFLVFGALLYWYGISFRKLINLKHILVILLIGITISIADEYLQILIPGRRFNPKDLYSNVLGTISGYFICKAILQKIKSIKPLS